MRLPPKVLPIVRIETLRLVMLVSEGAPFSLEVKHEKLPVSRHFVNQRGPYVILCVCEGAVVLVLAFGVSHTTEFKLVPLLVVKVFNFVVGHSAAGVQAVGDFRAEL
jgi:hypothetical protein